MTAAADITRADRRRVPLGLGTILIALCLALAALAPFGLSGYGLYVLTLTEIFAIVALGLNLLTGYAGQISLCHAAFFGVGAYATAILTQKVGVPFLLSLVIGALFTAFIGALAAVPAMRLKHLYLAIATLGLGVILQKIIFEWRSLTNGGGGLALPAPNVAGFDLGATGLYYLTLLCLALGLWGAWNVSRGRTGRALQIIKESEIAAGSLGIPSAKYKVTAFAISAFYAAIAGGLFAYLVRYINPESFNVGLSIAFLSMVVIGGLGTIGGSIVGAAFYVIVPELLRGIKDAPGLVFGLLLVIVMVLMPQGLWGSHAVSHGEYEMARLAIENVSVDFGGIHALRDVSFEIESGSIVGLIGPNGAGKSTLLNCISGITRPTKGRVRLDEIILSEMAASSVAGCGIGRVFQHPELVANLPVRENLLIACHRSLRYGLLSELLRLPNVGVAERAASRKVDDVLDRLGISESSETLIRKLPYGHRKLVDLARALLMDIGFLLLDEPIAGLNDAEVARLGSLLQRLRTELGLGTLVVEHNMPFVSLLCDRLVVLDLGQLIAIGPPADVLSDAKVMASYLGEVA